MSTNARLLPSYLAQRFHGWQATTYAENRAWYRRLATDGQRPRTMVIACCDSRVHVTSVFGADSGEFFIHRNIANLVPPFAPNGDHHGTSAAVEYAVTTLRVVHVIVLGHSNCGGVAGCHAMCTGKAPHLEEETSFVGNWLKIMKPGFDKVAHLPEEEGIPALERESVIQSMANLMTFPFVREAVEAQELTLHGLINDIGEGVLLQYDGSIEKFVPV